MFIVKRLGKNGLWSAVSLIDKNGSFRGEAKFETRKDAEDYLKEYLKKMKTRTPNSAGVGSIKVFDENEEEKNESDTVAKSSKGHSKSKKKIDIDD